MRPSILKVSEYVEFAVETVVAASGREIDRQRFGKDCFASSNFCRF